MATLAERVDALKTDFAVPGTNIPSLVEHVADRLGMADEISNQPLGEQVRLLYESVHGSTALATAAASDGDAPPIAMGVPIESSDIVEATPATSTWTSFIMGESSDVATVTGSLMLLEQPPITNNPTRSVDAAIMDAIRIGAPTYNAGDISGCYFMYRRTAEEIVARIAQPRAAELLKSALLQAALEAEAGSARRAAWTMRRAFDECLRRRSSLSGEALVNMPSARALFSERSSARDASITSITATAGRAPLAVVAAGGASSTTTAKRAIEAAIEIGAPVYNRRNKSGCYYIYKRTAEEMHGRLADGPTRARIERALARARTLADGAGDDDGAAWAMRRCFDELLAGSANPRLEGMPTARAIRQEPEFPAGGTGAAVGSSCCVIA